MSVATQDVAITVPDQGENKNMEAKEFKRKYPGSPYRDMRDTRFAEILEKGHIAVVRASYFERCLVSKTPFADRANIPDKDFIRGAELLKLWEKLGARFLLIFSYAWLTAAHPDPDMFHLRRMVRILKEVKACHNSTEILTGHGEKKVQELGVIIDFCSLWQAGPGEDDKRTAAQKEQFKAGLKEINSPYAHQEITAVKLTSVPKEVSRKYSDRGWTLFESLLVDGKEGSAKISSSCTVWGRNGYYNVLVVDDGFDPEKEKNKGQEFVDYWATHGKRSPPCTPARFEQQMKEREEKAKTKGVNLFTSGSDQPFVLDKYTAAYEELLAATNFSFTYMEWGDREMEQLVDVLPQCRQLQTLRLDFNKIGDKGIETLTSVLPSLPSLQTFWIHDNKFSDNGAQMLVETLPALTSLQNFIYGKKMSGEAQSHMKEVWTMVKKMNEDQTDKDKMARKLDKQGAYRSICNTLRAEKQELERAKTEKTQAEAPAQLDSTPAKQAAEEAGVENEKEVEKQPQEALDTEKKKREEEPQGAGEEKREDRGSTPQKQCCVVQ